MTSPDRLLRLTFSVTSQSERRIHWRLSGPTKSLDGSSKSTATPEVSPRTFRKLGQVYFSRREYQKAEEAFEQAEDHLKLSDSCESEGRST